jgi:hypothetical protein
VVGRALGDEAELRLLDQAGVAVRAVQVVQGLDPDRFHAARLRGDRAASPPGHGVSGRLSRDRKLADPDVTVA